VIKNDNKSKSAVCYNQQILLSLCLKGSGRLCLQHWLWGTGKGARKGGTRKKTKPTETWD